MPVQGPLWVAVIAALFSPTLAYAQTEAAEHKSKPGHPPAVITLDVWMLTLTRDAGDNTFEAARQQLADRDAARARVRRLQKAGATGRSHHFMATTLENEELIVHVGAREPRAQAMNITQFGKQQSIIYEPVGTNLQATVHLDDESRVVVELNLESSYLEDSDVALLVPKEGEPTIARQVASSIFHARLACPSGGAVVASATQSQAGSENSATLIYVAAEVLK